MTLIYILIHYEDTNFVDAVMGIVRSYRDVIVVTKIATIRTSKAQSIFMY